MKLVANNKKARHDYFIEETYEAGIALTGTEIKSVRQGKVSIKESYAKISGEEVILHGMNISPYEQGNRFNVDPLRERKLLLHKREIRKLIGYTTDGIGFMEAAKEVDMDPVGKTMVVFGGGGAALSILAQAAIDGVKKIYVFNRKGKSWDNIEKKLPLFKEGTSCEIIMEEYANKEALKKALDEAYLLVNASSVGMAPNEDGCLIDDANLFHKGLNVFDIIYNPAETKLMKMAKEAGCNTANGKMMLLYQGAAAFTIWTEKTMPVDLVKEKVFPNSTTKQ